MIDDVVLEGLLSIWKYTPTCRFFSFYPWLEFFLNTVAFGYISDVYWSTIVN
jgi:hypothetical protein